jgi:hypothetical protein
VSDFNQILNFLTYFHRSHQYQFLRKSVQWEPRWYMQSDRRHQSKRVHVRWFRSSCKVADIFSLFFINIFSHESPTSDFRNIHPLGTELIHSDGRTSTRSDMTKVTGTFATMRMRLPRQSIGLTTGYDIEWGKISKLTRLQTDSNLKWTTHNEQNHLQTKLGLFCHDSNQTNQHHYFKISL